MWYAYMSRLLLTIGAPKVVLECISRVNRYMRTARQTENNVERNKLLSKSLFLLSVYSEHEDAIQNMSFDENNDFSTPEMLGKRSQSNAFLCATHIYIYRSLLDVPPQTVRTYVAETFSHVSAFFAENTGNFSIWPAFIAAVEAYTLEDQASARCWLDRATVFGLGNRALIRRVVEEVWRQRATLSEASGLEHGKLAVDWRPVMQELN
ncbi:hypothetical protein BU16DRAFT_561691 [Lophium mytilinum]|uniref:Fungal-specific transcription factor domain-containing protein n=1 Tax=Lophium mytilinum TaxID=390894 RepID=A0A6A6QTF7_9PEZI|nr:hypothetical protein BU16DRAFT_561691 [Lophium mytilinum]